MPTKDNAKQDRCRTSDSHESTNSGTCGNTENGQMPEDVIERKMFDFDAVRKETDGGTNDSFESSTDVEVREQESQPSDNATQHSNFNTLDRRSNIQSQQSKSKSDNCSRKERSDSSTEDQSSDSKKE